MRPSLFIRSTVALALVGALVPVVAERAFAASPITGTRCCGRTRWFVESRLSAYQMCARFSAPSAIGEPSAMANARANEGMLASGPFTRKRAGE